MKETDDTTIHIICIIQLCIQIGQRHTIGGGRGEVEATEARQTRSGTISTIHLGVGQMGGNPLEMILGGKEWERREWEEPMPGGRPSPVEFPSG